MLESAEDEMKCPVAEDSGGTSCGIRCTSDKGEGDSLPAMNTLDVEKELDEVCASICAQYKYRYSPALSFYMA